MPAKPSSPPTVDELVRSPQRLAAVRRSGLLDSPAEESFDALTRLAARLLGVPASFVSVIDSHRDFYKSQSGFPEELACARELSGRTFCHFTLQGDEALVIGDTHADDTWKAVPTVQSLGVRAYAGVPLKLDGQTIGSFCVIDMQPREWKASELEILGQLAISAGRELSLRQSLAAERTESAYARELARLREEVVAVVAHDLRTPLQVLQLSAAVLERGAQESQRPVVGRMVNAVKAMATMTDSLLARGALLAAPAIPHQAVTAATLVEDAIGMMGPIAERADIALAPAPVADATIRIDYARMLRVLGNLVGNAIKYSPAGSQVTVGAQRDGDILCISVADNGRGMSAQEQARAFDAGWQGAEGMVRGDGAGLGLSIAKGLVEEHGGRVELASEPGRGTTLRVCLPCS